MTEVINPHAYCRSLEHPMTGKNVIIRKNGQRLCRACRNMKARVRYETNKGAFPYGQIWPEYRLKAAGLHHLTNQMERLQKDISSLTERLISLQEHLAAVKAYRAPIIKAVMDEQGYSKFMENDNDQQ